jgi:hypothetical protein
MGVNQILDGPSSLATCYFIHAKGGIVSLNAQQVCGTKLEKIFDGARQCPLKLPSLDAQ